MKSYITVFSICLMVLLSINSKAQNLDATRKMHFNNIANAVKGYDVVSYFKENKAQKGSKNWSFQYGNVKYYFSSLENFNLFKENPAKYEPQYGGWCAYAMGTTGERWDIDPKTFKIVNGKLFLFYNKGFNNTLNAWNKNETKYLQEANTRWKMQFK
jgi:YHS domain-containing protein